MGPQRRLLIVGFAGGEIPKFCQSGGLGQGIQCCRCVLGATSRRHEAADLCGQTMRELRRLVSGTSRQSRLIEGRYHAGRCSAGSDPRAGRRGAVGKIRLIPRSDQGPDATPLFCTISRRRGPSSFFGLSRDRKGGRQG